MEAETSSAWVRRWAEGVTTGGRVLDVACGSGRHTRLFAARGYEVTAVDRDPSHAAGFEREPLVRFVAADLETGPWPLGDMQFDAIVVTHYLHRPLFPALRSALVAGGLLIYETFASGNAEFGRPSSPDYLLQPRELLDAFGDLRVLAFEDGFVAAWPAMMQRIAARNAGTRAALPAPQCRL